MISLPVNSQLCVFLLDIDPGNIWVFKKKKIFQLDKGKKRKNRSPLQLVLKTKHVLIHSNLRTTILTTLIDFLVFLQPTEINTFLLC